jgi:hypothetical protein
VYGIGNKKMLNMFILEILRNYTDEDHSLTQQEIIKLLEKNYGTVCDRRSVKNNVLLLKEFGESHGFEVSMEDGYRMIFREFDDTELRILIDSVLFSKAFSANQTKELIKKIKGLSSKYFNAKVSNICNIPEFNKNINRQNIYSIDKINDAISGKHKISFVYNDIGTDFKLHPRRKESYIVNPYRIVANNGKFYLIGNYDKYDNIVHFRIDRMTDVCELEERVKPMKDVPELSSGLNLPRHMAEHIYMFSGKSTAVKLLTTKDMMSELVDWFGTDFSIIKKVEEKIIVRVNCNEKAMRFWALQYGPYVEVLEPESLRNKIKEDITYMSKKYSDG